MSQVAASRRGALPGFSRAWIALRNHKALFCVVFALVFAGFATPVLLAPRDFHVRAEVPVAGTSNTAEELAKRLSDPKKISAALSGLERFARQPVLTATPSADRLSVLVEARGSSPQSAGDLITALLRRDRREDREARLAEARAALEKARKQRSAVDATLAALQGKLTALEQENAARNERNRKALAANSEAERRRSQQASARSEARTHAKSIEQALDRRRYIGARIDVLVDEIQGLRARLASTPETVTDVATQSSAYAQELRLRLDGLLGEREDLIAQRGAGDPAVGEIDARIRRMRQRVAQEPAETREETKRPNPARAMVASRLRMRESELASINAEREQVISRIARLQSTPAPREPVTASVPARIAKAVLEPVLDAGPVRERLELAKKQRQEAEAAVQRVARRQRELAVASDAALPSLQYPAPKPLEVRNFLVPLGAALVLSLMAVAAGEIRARKPAAPTNRLRRRRTIEDRSRQQIENLPAEAEQERERERAEPAAQAVPPPRFDPAIGVAFAQEGEIASPPPLHSRDLAPSFIPRTTPSTPPAPLPAPETGLAAAPQMPVAAPSSLRSREISATYVPWTAPAVPVPMPETGSETPGEMPVFAPPPIRARDAGPALIPRTVPTAPMPMPETLPSSAPEMPVAGPPPAYLRAREATYAGDTISTEPVPVPDTWWAETPEIKVDAPPLIPITGAAATFVARTTSLEPPQFLPESLAAIPAEPEDDAPPVALSAPARPLIAGTIASEPSFVQQVAEEPAVAKVARPTRRVRIVRRLIAAPLVELETQAAPVAEPIAAPPPLAPSAPSGPTLVFRSQPAVPTEERVAAPLVEAEPVRDWVDLSPADLVPEDVAHAPEAASDLAREAVFSGQPITLIQAPATVAIPAAPPVEPSEVPAVRPQRVSTPKTRPRPLRELASLSRNLNPLTVAHEPGAAYADAEALNRVREAIEFAECRSLLVCGAHRGDGASHTALLLAAHLSSRGWPVVLVDADFRHRTLHRALRVPHLPGFSEFLMELADFREVLQETEYERLAAVSAGPLLADPVLLLQPMRVDRAIRIMRELGALVIIDGGAALAEPQAELLAPFVDGALLVSRHGKGGGWTLKKANERLHAAQARVLGLVRNPQRS